MLILVPAGRTRILQPLDVSINKPFKDFLRKNYNNWIENFGSTKENTGKIGNIKSAKKWTS
jgi:hypothetical protein